MIIKADGTTRSTDTATARVVTDVTGDVVTLNGAVLADADGSGGGAEIYLSYWEPTTKTAINNPVTGLVGTMQFADLTACFRSATITMTNNHELVNYCYGQDSLGSPFFVPGNRFQAELAVVLNLNDKLIQFFNQVQSFDAKDFTAVLGDATGRHMQVLMPKVFFPVPAFTVPETGSIPVTFTGNAYQTALDAADEVTVSFI
jgi:hypothetical protein